MPDVISKLSIWHGLSVCFYETVEKQSSQSLSNLMRHYFAEQNKMIPIYYGEGYSLNILEAFNKYWLRAELKKKYADEKSW